MSKSILNHHGSKGPGRRRKFKREIRTGISFFARFAVEEFFSGSPVIEIEAPKEFLIFKIQTVGFIAALQAAGFGDDVDPGRWPGLRDGGPLGLGTKRADATRSGGRLSSTN